MKGNAPCKTTGRAEFCSVVRSLRQQGHGRLYGWIVPNSDRELVVGIEPGKRLLPPLGLAEEEDAGRFWDSLWESREELLLVCFEDGSPLACMATVGAWNALSDVGLVYSKAHFTQVEEDEFREIVGDEYDRMCKEAFLMSISVRTVSARGGTPSRGSRTKKRSCKGRKAQGA